MAIVRTIVPGAIIINLVATFTKLKRENALYTVAKKKELILAPLSKREGETKRRGGKQQQQQKREHERSDVGQRILRLENSVRKKAFRKDACVHRSSVIRFQDVTSPPSQRNSTRTKPIKAPPAARLSRY